MTAYEETYRVLMLLRRISKKDCSFYDAKECVFALRSLADMIDGGAMPCVDSDDDKRFRIFLKPSELKELQKKLDDETRSRIETQQRNVLLNEKIDQIKKMIEVYSCAKL